MMQSLFVVFYIIVHGTHLGRIQLEANKPMQLAIDDTFHFGASTRRWILREKPTTANVQDTSLNSSVGEETDHDTSVSSLMGLPETETELDVRLSFF